MPALSKLDWEENIMNPSDPRGRPLNIIADHRLKLGSHGQCQHSDPNKVKIASHLPNWWRRAV